MDKLLVKELLTELEDYLDLKENYFDGYYLLYEFSAEYFEKIYSLTKEYLGDRTEFDEKILETTWIVKLERGQKITIKLYQEHLEVFTDIPTSENEIGTFSGKQNFEISKPEELEYLQKRKEAQKEKIQRLNNLSQKEKENKLDELKKLRKRRIEEELSYQKNKKAEIKLQLQELQNLEKQEEQKIQELKELVAKENEAEQKTKRIEELKKKREIYEKELSNSKREKARRTLPVGYDYKLKFYEEQLDILRNTFGQDDQIDDLMGEWQSGNPKIGKRERSRLFAKYYVHYYRAKYLGINGLYDFDNPEKMNESFDEYLSRTHFSKEISKINNDNDFIGNCFVIFLIIASAIIVIVGLFGDIIFGH